MRRPPLISLVALVLLGAYRVHAEPSEGGVRVWGGQRPRPPGASLLLRIEGAATEVDRVRIELPDRESAQGATSGALPRGWAARPKRSRIELEGPPTPLPLYLRLDSSDRQRLDAVEVTVSSGKRTVHAGEVALEQLPPVEVSGSASELVLLPPLLTPGETIELTVLDPAKTAGVWSLGSETALPTAEGSATRLRVRVPDGTSIDGPPDLSYVEPWGETIVRASVLEQARIVPAGLPEPSAPRLGPCGLRTASHWAICTCGWFPTEEARHGILVDGSPRSSPLAASRRSVCVAAAAGPHRLTGAAAVGFDPRREQETVAMRVSSALRGTLSLKPGESATRTWTVTGTSEPVRLRLRNTSPGVGGLEGGDLQIAVTSGGSPNTVSRTVTGLNSGTFRVAVEIDEPLDSSPDREYPQLIAAVFRRELKRIAAQAEAAALELRAERTGSPPRPTVRRDDVIALLGRVETEVRNALPFPELAAFRDATSELIDEIRREAMTMAVAARASSAGAVHFVANDPAASARLDEASVRALVSRLIEWLESAGAASPVRMLCIVTTPVNGAEVALYPSSFPSDRSAVTSHSRLTLTLGRYNYEIQRRDYLQSKGSINLLLNPEQVVECPLARSVGDSTACRLLAQSLERCP